MDGEIGVESVPGEGSTFWLTLNLANIREQPASTSLIDPINEYVLVVDDNVTTGESIDGVLDSFQVQHQLTVTGQEALQALRDASEAGQPLHYRTY